MADNDPPVPQSEVDPTLVRPDESQPAITSTDAVTAREEAQEEQQTNKSAAGEPKTDASASEQISSPSDETEEGT
ncbi:hypothetical protein FRC09_015313, partial [Ceratobasidium sp. 395]